MNQPQPNAALATQDSELAGLISLFGNAEAIAQTNGQAQDLSAEDFRFSTGSIVDGFPALDLEFALGDFAASPMMTTDDPIGEYLTQFDQPVLSTGSEDLILFAQSDGLTNTSSDVGTGGFIFPPSDNAEVETVTQGADFSLGPIPGQAGIGEIAIDFDAALHDSGTASFHTSGVEAIEFNALPDDFDVDIPRIDGLSAGAAQLYSPEVDGWHFYIAGPNLVCPADFGCTPTEIADQLTRFSVPGQDPATPAVDLGTYFVTDPRFDLPAGFVRTRVSPDGLTISNSTIPGQHIFHDGQIVRTATQSPDGAWHITTQGFGNNVYPGAATLNEWQGPAVFNYMDEQMRLNIQRHHGR